MDHQALLEKVCRTCKNKIKLYDKYRKAKTSIDYHNEILALFKIDVKKEDSSVFPKFICESCKQKFERCHKDISSASSPDTLPDFQPHNDSDCDICFRPLSKQKNKGFKLKIHTGMSDNQKVSMSISSQVLSECSIEEAAIYYDFVKVPQSVNDDRTFVNFTVNDKGNVVTKYCITVFRDNSWSLSLYGNNIDSETTKSLPSIIDTANALLLFSKFSQFKVCEGNIGFEEIIKHKIEKGTEYCLKANSDIGEFLDDLTDILDPTGIDPLIDWPHCIIGLQDWIAIVNKRSIDTYNNMSPPKPPPVSHISPIKLPFIGTNGLSPKYTSTAKKTMRHLDNRRFSSVSTYSNESLETSDLSWDHSDIHTRMEELEITNKRLLEENLNLKRHLDATEDQNVSVLQENDSLKVKITKCEKMIDENRQVNQSYEELKSTVFQFENIKNDLQEKMLTLEKENKCLQTAIYDYEGKITQLDNTIENIKEEKEKLADDLSIQKNLLNQIEDLKTSRENVVEESASKSEYLASVIAELSLANEVLKAQKTNVENELSELKQEFSQSMMLHQHGDVSTTMDQLPKSLHQELQAGTSNNGSDVHLEVNAAEEDSPFDSPMKERYSLIAKQCREKFIEKKEIVIGKIDEIIKGKSRQSEKFDSSIIVNDLNNELESFTEKITEFAQGKQDAERRAIRLVATIRKLRDENIALQESRDKALLKFGNLSISCLESEERLQSLTRLVDEKIGCIEDLTSQLQTLRKDHSTDISSYEETIRFLKSKVGVENVAPIRKEVDDLKTLVEDLTNINIEKTKKIYELEDNIKAKDECKETLQEKISKIENELTNQIEEHKRDLENIYHLIPHKDKIRRRKSAVSCEDIRIALELFVETSRHECNKLLGVRESPDGGPHQNDNLNSDQRKDIVHNNNNNNRVSPTITKELHRTNHQDRVNSLEDTRELLGVSSQTSIDMVTMTKMYENFENTTQLNNCTLENMQTFDMIPVEELPEDISFADNHLCSILEEQLQATSNIIKTDMNEHFPLQNENSHPFSVCSTTRSSPTGNSGESSYRTDHSEQSSFENELKNQTDNTEGNFPLKIFIESYDDGVIRTARDSDFDRFSSLEETYDDVSSKENLIENIIEKTVTSDVENDVSDSFLENESENSLLEDVPVSTYASPKNISDSEDEVVAIVTDEIPENTDYLVETPLETLDTSSKELSLNSVPENLLDNSSSHDTSNVLSQPQKTLSSSLSHLDILSNSDYNSDSDIEKLQGKLANLNISNIIEFDRSDMSSDSDGEISRRMSLASRRRHRLSRRNRAASEMLYREQHEIEENDFRETQSEQSTPLTKQRRVGVSAEPVRVSWSALREAFKKQNLGEESDHGDVEDTTDGVENNEAPLIVTLEDVESTDPPCVLLAENQQTSFDSIPKEDTDEITHNADGNDTNQISKNELKDNDNGTSQENISSTSKDKSPKSSLQVPPGIIFESMMDSIPLRYQVPFQEDKELERKFNNAVFSFQTDQYTLHKRLENQERARDVAESGMDKEIQKLDSTIMSFVALQRGSVEFEEVLNSLQSQTCILQKAAMKISAQSEQHGCYQQESRQVSNISTMIDYADHLRTHIAKLTEEIVEYRKRFADPERWRSVLPQEREVDETKDDDTNRASDENPLEKADGEEEVSDISEKRKSRQSFSSISKTLIMAQGLSKLQGSRRSQHLSAPLLKRRKRVSFGQVDYSDDVIDLTSPSTSAWWEKPLRLIKENRTLVIRITVVLVLFLLLLFFFFMMFKSIEVEDRDKLIDKVLGYVPHTIEHRKPNE